MDLRSVDMDYLEAFVASLYLANKQEIKLQQEEFNKPIFLSSL